MCTKKYSRLRYMFRVKGLVICLYLGRSGSIFQFRQNMIKVGSKSWLLTCSSDITLSLPSYTGSALKRELKFCNGCLSLLYFCKSQLIAIISYSFPIGRTCFIKWMQRFEVGRQNGRQAEAHPLILQLPFNVGSKNFREHVLLSNFRVAVQGISFRSVAF